MAGFNTFTEFRTLTEVTDIIAEVFGYDGEIPTNTMLTVKAAVIAVRAGDVDAYDSNVRLLRKFFGTTPESGAVRRT